MGIGILFADGGISVKDVSFTDGSKIPAGRSIRIEAAVETDIFGPWLHLEYRTAVCGAGSAVQMGGAVITVHFGHIQIVTLYRADRGIVAYYTFGIASGKVPFEYTLGSSASAYQCELVDASHSGSLGIGIERYYSDAVSCRPCRL